MDGLVLSNLNLPNLNLSERELEVISFKKYANKTNVILRAHTHLNNIGRIP
ncbi:hypothetical protein CRE_11956 [Caenorhabditis remanei]|uniref:Uncharacterized protein n=1 Tax=Caenorhabditis remanei TaxID=31234 RepID=E3M4P6_CAERE|nr:hypothetical protein CRE_11956 [Caenorhabditis remanei]